MPSEPRGRRVRRHVSKGSEGVYPWLGSSAQVESTSLPHAAVAAERVDDKEVIYYCRTLEELDVYLGGVCRLGMACADSWAEGHACEDSEKDETDVSNDGQTYQHRRQWNTL
jgi:hypothetical protein